MGKACNICKRETVFFIWCTSRNINKLRIGLFVREPDLDTGCICHKCAVKHDLLIKRPELIMNKPRVYRTWDDLRREKLED